MQHQLFGGETIVEQWGTLVLTTHRIRSQGENSFTSIPLRKVEWVALHKKSYPVILVLAVLLAVSGFYIGINGNTNAFFGGGFSGLFLLLVFMATRRVSATIGAGVAQVSQLVSGPTRVLGWAGGKDVDKAVSFLAAVERQALSDTGQIR